MKRILLTLPDKTNDGFIIRLAGKQTIQFTNVLKAEKYLNELNTFLTSQLVHLNSLFATIINEYREHWVLFDTNRTSGRAQKIENNKLIIDRITENLNLFETILFQAETRNGFYLVYHSFEKIVKNMLFVTDVLKNMDVEKSYYSQVQRLNIIEKYCNEILYSINNYSQSKN